MTPFGRLAAAALCLLPAAAHASSLYQPGEGEFGTLLFEDQWPCAGDADFNDVVVRYNFRTETYFGAAAALVVNIDVQAVGARLCNGIALRLPVDTATVGAVTRQVGTAGHPTGGAWGAAEPVQVTANSDGHPVLWLVDDIRTELCGGASGYLNTNAAEPIVDCAPLTVVIPFVSDPSLPAAAPYDLFLHRCGDRTVQIHRPAFSGTDEMDVGLYGTCADGSTPGSWFVQGSGIPGLPFALDIAEDAPWPREFVRIDATMPQIVSFAAGTGGEAFYQPANVVTSNAFSRGAGVPVDPPVAHPVTRLAVQGGAVRWDDGSVAESCAQYLRPGAGHRSYAGAVGSGRYTIDDGGGEREVYCDMDTADGGWTLCLNSRYTAAAAGLFVSSYAPIDAPGDDVFGYYDWCPQDEGEYLFTLADRSGDDYTLHTATVALDNAEPWNDSGEWTDVGIRALRSDATWVNQPAALRVDCLTSDYYNLAFFEYINPAYRGLKGFKRGHISCHMDTLPNSSGTSLVMGSGCNYAACTSGPSWESDLYPTWSAWTWRVVATAGNGNGYWKAGPYQGERTLVFYR